MANIGYIQVNRYCNNQCHFCSNPSNGNNISLERGIELIDDFIKREYSGIIFTGGEPTLSPDLAKWINYANDVGMENRMISNGMMCSDYNFTKKLADAGLKLVHFSVYSCHEKIHDFLTDTPGSWKKLMMSITNALKLGVRVQINTVINHYNENHLDKTVKFLTKHFPQIKHFVWNNLDPLMMRKTKTALSTLPNYDEASKSLLKAMAYLDSTNRTFRVERFPLCYMRGYEWASTETRKIVKDEERMVHFLDERETIRQNGLGWEHDKLEGCKKCDLNSICSGIFEYKNYYNYVKVYPQKLSISEKEELIKKIKGKF
ncbi:MAG: radical SAM protein [Candidatus Gracilibacteria bacterium]|nr:radical SAM protein [Candidatus Gracilibacteria bacterium]